MTTALRPSPFPSRPRARRTGPAGPPQRPREVARPSLADWESDGSRAATGGAAAAAVTRAAAVGTTAGLAGEAEVVAGAGAAGRDVTPRAGSGTAPVAAVAAPPAVGSGGDGPPDRALTARRPLALSPSRAADFKQCPLLYRLRAIDRLVEPPSGPAARGTLVHAVLESLFGRPAQERTRDAALAAVRPTWTALVEQRPDLDDVVPAAELDRWLASAEALVATYFALEDPRRITSEACELGLDLVVEGGLPLRGFLDRVDISPTGLVRVVDYKTGRSPDPAFEASALYQLKFYALMIYRSRGVVPAQLKLIYLGDGATLTYTTSESELLAFEQSVRALWTTVTAAVTTGDFPATPGRGCTWCTHQVVCPAFDGTPPDYPVGLVPELLAAPGSPSAPPATPGS